MPKGDGIIRICGDYKVTTNMVASLDKYPLPRIEDLFASLSGGQTFLKLDLSQAYQQVKSNRGGASRSVVRGIEETSRVRNATEGGMQFLLVFYRILKACHRLERVEYF
uniref:Reverse transcriptase domain-containing protein n=1 Tax=Amphimedon queenslandica TaxID=400682 RepID=A0A1X7VSN9_AMPQE